MKIGITGHRPERITDPEKIRRVLSESMDYIGATRIYQGMAAGVDLWSAKEAWKLNIPYVCVRPWAGHQPRFSDEIEYGKVLNHASEVIDVSGFQDYTGPWLYSKRNEYIVDASDVMIAVWDGLPYGGTFNCVKYSWAKAIPVWRIDVDGKSSGYVSENVPF